MCETVRSTSIIRSRFQELRMLRKCSSCSLFMYASPRLVMYGVTLRGPASRLPGSTLSSPSLSAARAAAELGEFEGTPVAVTTMRSGGEDLRIAWATDVAGGAGLPGEGVGFTPATAGFPVATGFAAAAGFGAGAAFVGAAILAAGDFTGAGFTGVLWF